MLRPSSGQIVVNGNDITAITESRFPKLRATKFGFFFQDSNLLSALTALENVEFALNPGGITGNQARKRAQALLPGLGMEDRLNFRPDKLTGGEKERLASARALANQPSVILADEPTANLEDRPRDCPSWDDREDNTVENGLPLFTEVGVTVEHDRVSRLGTMSTRWLLKPVFGGTTTAMLSTVRTLRLWPGEPGRFPPSS